MPDSLDQAALDGLLAMVGDDPEFVDELVDTYLQDAPGQIAELHSALAAGSIEALVRPAHTLKGASASLGARQVESIARQIEAKGREGSSDGVQELLTKLEGEYAGLLESMAEARRRRWVVA